MVYLFVKTKENLVNRFLINQTGVSRNKSCWHIQNSIVTGQLAKSRNLIGHFSPTTANLAKSYYFRINCEHTTPTINSTDSYTELSSYMKKTPSKQFLQSLIISLSGITRKYHVSTSQSHAILCRPQGYNSNSMMQTDTNLHNKMVVCSFVVFHLYQVTVYYRILPKWTLFYKLEIHTYKD